MDYDKEVHPPEVNEPTPDVDYPGENVPEDEETLEEKKEEAEHDLMSKYFGDEALTRPEEE